MSARNLERYIIILMNNGSEISKIELVRHLSPILIERIVRSLPIKAYTLSSSNRIILNINIPYASQKKKTQHEAGDVSYDALNKSLIIYFEKYEDDFENIGRVIEGLDNLKNLKTGFLVTLKL